MTSMRLPTPIVDRTAFTNHKLRIMTRASAAIDTVVLHQLSYSRGGDVTAYDKVVAHFVVLLEGHILKLHPIEAYLAASSALNDYSVSIEFAGNLPNENNYYWPGNSGRHVPTAEQIASGRDLIRMLNEQHGIGYIHAHRQGEGVTESLVDGKVKKVGHDRTNCPGPDIWFHIGEWAVAELGMDDGGKDFKEGRGLTIPDAWRKPRKR